MSKGHHPVSPKRGSKIQLVPAPKSTKLAYSQGSPVNGANLMAQLSSLGGGNQKLALSQLQRTQGNAYVQRMLAETGAGLVQRQSAPAEPVLRPGSTSPAVTTLQQHLLTAGAKLNADGVFGPKTRQAVVLFQKAAGLTPDGIVGPKTWASLKGDSVTIPVEAASEQKGQPQQPTALVAAKLAEVKKLLQALKAKQAQESAQKEAEAKTEDVTAPPVPTQDALGRNDGDEEEESIWGSVTSWAEEKAESASNWVEEQANSTAEWAGEQVNSAREWVEEKIDSTAEWANETYNEAEQWVGETVSSAAQGAESLMNNVNEMVSDIGQDLESLGEEVGNYLTSGFETIENIIKDLGSGFGLDPSSLGILDDFLSDLKKKLTGSEEPEEQPEQGPVSGSLPPIEVGTFTTAGCDLPDKADGLANLTAAPAIQSNRPSKPRRVKMQFSFVPTVSEGPMQGGQARLDSVRGNLSVEAQVSRGGVKQMQGFGREEVTATLDNITWTAKDDLVIIQARLLVDCHWDVNSQGRTNVGGANDPAVKDTNWDQVVADLTPDSTGQPPRKKFWAQDLTEKHEQFHARDDISKAQSFIAAKNLALGTKKIDMPWLWISDSDKKKIDFHVNLLLKDVAGEANTTLQEHYQNGGEARAYADGKADYQQRVTEIKNRAQVEEWPEWE